MNNPQILIQMKKLLFILALAGFLPALAMGQSPAMNRFYKTYKRTDESTHITLPGWVVRLGAGLAKGAAETEEEKAAFKLAGTIRKFRVLAIEDHNPVKAEDMDRLIAGLRRENMEELITVRDGQTRFHLFIKDKKQKKIKKALIVVQEPDAFTFVGLKTRLRYEQLQDLVNLATAER